MMHVGIIEENVPFYTQIGPGIWKYLGKKEQQQQKKQTTSPTPSWAVSRAGYSRKLILKQSKLKTFRVAGEALL